MDTLLLNTSNASGALASVENPKEIWTTVHILFLVFIILLMTLTIVGNGLIIAAWFVYLPLRTPSNLLLVSLAIPDFLLGALSMPLNSIQIISSNWLFGPVMCQLWTITNITFGFVSANHLVLIAWDRYSILTNGINYLQRRTYKSTLTSVAFVWFVGLCLTSPHIFDWTDNVIYNQKNETTWVCRFKKTSIHVLYPNIFLRLIPACLMIYLYSKIFVGIKARLRKNLNSKSYYVRGQRIDTNLGTVLDKSSSDGRISSEVVNIDTQDTQKTDSSEDSQVKLPKKMSPDENLVNDKLTICIKKERRAARTLGILIACFVFFWSPFLAASFLKVPFGITTSPLLFMSFAVFGWINSAVNPIIYAIHNKDFKIAFKRMGLPIKT